MLTIRINNRKISEDYVAVPRPNGVFPLSGRHFIAIISLCLFSAVCSIPAGNYIPLSFDASAVISAMGRSAAPKGSEQIYLQNDEKLAEASLEITTWGESQENYDDTLLPSELFASQDQDEEEPYESSEVIASREQPLREPFEAGHKFLGALPAGSTAPEEEEAAADEALLAQLPAEELAVEDLPAGDELPEETPAGDLSDEELLAAAEAGDFAEAADFEESAPDESEILPAPDLETETEVYAAQAEEAAEEPAATNTAAGPDAARMLAAVPAPVAPAPAETAAASAAAPLQPAAELTPAEPAPAMSAFPWGDMLAGTVLSDSYQPEPALPAAPAAEAVEEIAPAVSAFPWGDMLAGTVLSDHYQPEPAVPAAPAAEAVEEIAPAVAAFPWGDMLAGTILSDHYQPEPAVPAATAAEAAEEIAPAIAAFPWGDMLAGTVLSDHYQPQPAVPAAPAAAAVKEIEEIAPAVAAFPWGDMLAGTVLSDSYQPLPAPVPAEAPAAAVEEQAAATAVPEEPATLAATGVAVTKGSRHRPAGTWYKHTVARGETLASIFNSLSLPRGTLKKITRAARKNEMKLTRGTDIHFLVDRRGYVMEMVKPLAKGRQVRFTRMNVNRNFKSVREKAGAHFAAPVNPASFLAANEMPTAAAAAAKALAREQALAKAQQAEEKAREAEAKALPAADSGESLIAEAQTAETAAENTPAVPGSQRPRLIIGSLRPKESFDKAAKRAGLTSSEIATIKKEIPSRKLNVSKLLPGDSFRVLFNGIGTKANISAVEIKSKKAGKISIFRHPDNKRFFEENAFKPTAGVFRRFPINGKIKINSPYNPRRMHPLRRRIVPHWGVDFKVNVGTPVYAPADGTVNFAGYMRGGGYTVILKHAGAYSTVYMHLSKLDVRKGQKVHVGQIIAKSGNTGASTGAHLHYELRINGKAVNPLKATLPSNGTPALAKKQRERFKSTVSTLKADLYKDSLAMRTAR